MRDLLRKINKLNAIDKMVKEILGSAAEEMDKTDLSMHQIVDDMFFNTCSEDMLKFYEWEAGIKPTATQTMGDRRSAVEAKWKSSGKVDVEMLQAVADSWKHGKVAVDFVDNKIQITFIDQYGLPADRKGLEFALDEVKPAHLPIIYFVRYLMLEDIEAMTLAGMETQMLSNFAFK